MVLKNKMKYCIPVKTVYETLHVFGKSKKNEDLRRDIKLYIERRTVKYENNHQYKNCITLDVDFLVLDIWGASSNKLLN